MRTALGTICVFLTAALSQPVMRGSNIKHVLVISIDGLHSQDLAKWIQNNKKSTLASLAANAVNYTNAFTTQPSDSIPSTVGIFTGASPALAGMYYDDAWHRRWSPLGSTCTTSGTLIDLKDTIDVQPEPMPPTPAVLDPARLVRDPDNGCSAVFPHNMIRVNTVFEVVSAAGMYTAYSEKRPSYDFLNGPSGTGVKDLYTPEIAFFNLLNLTQIEQFDQTRVQSVINEINEMNHDGTQEAPKPALFGMNFQSVNSAKKFSSTSGYTDAAGDFDASMTNAMQYVDGALGSIMSALQSQGIAKSTAIVITAKHGESPLTNKRTVVLTSTVSKILNAAINSSGTVGIPFNKITQKTSPLIWLANPADTAAAVTALSNASAIDPVFAANVTQVLSFGNGLPFPQPGTGPGTDPAPPDIVVVMKAGVNFESSLTSTTHAEHGGFGENETHVPLMVYLSGWSPLTQGATVSTRQIAPTVLMLLGLDPNALQAVQIEGVAALADVVTRLQ